MSQNDFYGNSGSGGGFLNNGSPFGSASGSPGGYRKSESQQSLRPMTVAQLYKATQAHTDADWCLDDSVIGQITIVVHVREIKQQATNTSYTVSDGSADIEARHWNESSSEEDQARWGGIKEGSYVRINGQIKAFNNRRYINALNMRPVEDYMEVYFHILEAITITLYMERGPPPGKGDAPKIGQAGGSGASAYRSPATGMATNSNKWGRLPKIQQDILQYMLSQSDAAEGVHVGNIARAIGGDASEISDALDALMDEGNIFSTIDDSHFKVSD